MAKEFVDFGKLAENHKSLANHAANPLVAAWLCMAR
jgi:hypothetical protein